MQNDRTRCNVSDAMVPRYNVYRSYIDRNVIQLTQCDTMEQRDTLVPRLLSRKLLENYGEAVANGQLRCNREGVETDRGARKLATLYCGRRKKACSGGQARHLPNHRASVPGAPGSTATQKEPQGQAPEGLAARLSRCVAQLVTDELHLAAQDSGSISDYRTSTTGFRRSTRTAREQPRESAHPREIRGVASRQETPRPGVPLREVWGVLVRRASRTLR